MPERNAVTKHYSQTILLVEDNKSDRELIMHWFGKYYPGVVFMIAGDGSEALEILQKITDDKASVQPDPSLILLDMKLPKMNGLEFLNGLRDIKHLQHIPVILLCSNREEVEFQLADAGLDVSGFLEKHVDARKFEREIRRLGELLFAFISTQGTQQFKSQFPPPHRF